MKAVVISGGLYISKQRAMACLKDSDFIICADKGAEYAQMYGVTPDMIVGDMDSVDTAKLDRYEKKLISISPREKDFTDTHLAVIKALEAGADEIAVICATGLRSDHALANIRLLIYIYENNAAGKIIDDENTITLCTETANFKNKKGVTVSILSLSDHTEGICLEGFKYPIKNLNADLQWTTGISNEIVSDNACISIKNGRLLIFEIH